MTLSFSSIVSLSLSFSLPRSISSLSANHVHVLCSTDRERWLTAIDNEASKAGHAVESIYEDAELTHYEVTTEHIASETDELTLTLGNTVLARRKAQDGKSAGRRGDCTLFKWTTCLIPQCGSY